jgi:Rad3-related DNA helicase
MYVEPVANMVSKETETQWPIAAERVQQIVDWHDERILVHTVSYKLADYLVAKIGPRAVTYRKASEREDALARFRQSPNGVLVAPSFERGIDLPYDQCRVVVVTKVPFPYLGDKQVSKRLYSRGGQGWYAMQTVRSLVQMTGRAMRHADDKCEIYIIDRQFMSNVWKKSRHLLPQWWKDALVMGGSPNLAAVRSGNGK